ncbi:GNAT family N-acetyltransferase [Streptomyces sp. NPDC018019]|uniref:GNAT family N-acetyltransferase n=1 Tax=Streptomyces sp. NPDC018019 TaxID=3365030 RepID=UPI0037BB2369
MFLFSGDPLRPGRTDPEFGREAGAVRAIGAPSAVVDHEALVAGDAARAVARVPRGAGPAWYRGWMLPAGRYAALAAALDERGCRLLTAPQSYRAAHELPGWYALFAHLTPYSRWLPCAPGEPPGAAELARLAGPLGGGPVMVKDWVKSRKHEWEEAAYVPDASDAARLASVVGRFVALQEEFLTGGVVLRAFESYGTAGEARVWWVDGEPVLVGAHPDTPERCPVPDLSEVAPVVRAALRKLGCRFITTDLALRADGVWRVVEVGDGQVSGLPAGADTGTLIEALATAGAGYPLALAAGRVVLRPVLPTAAARLAAGDGRDDRPGGPVWAGGRPPESTAACAGTVAGAAHRPGWGLFTIVRADDGTAVGSICFHGPPDGEGAVEIGYALCPAARGAGWATEATRLLADWASGRPEVRTVRAVTEPVNVPSQRVLERAGFVRSGDRYGLREYVFAGA